VEEEALRFEGAPDPVVPAGRERTGRRSGVVSCREDPADLVGEDLDGQAGDEAGHHRPGQEVREKRKAEEPDDEEDQAAEEGECEGGLHAGRTIGSPEHHQRGGQKRCNRGVGARDHVTR